MQVLRKSPQGRGHKGVSKYDSLSKVKTVFIYLSNLGIEDMKFLAFADWYLSRVKNIKFFADLPLTNNHLISAVTADLHSTAQVFKLLRVPELFKKLVALLTKRNSLVYRKYRTYFDFSF